MDRSRRPGRTHPLDRSDLAGWSRRAVLGAGGLGAAGLLLPGSSRAAPAPVDRRFVFVVAYGGWDVSRMLGAAHGLGAMDVEPDAVVVDGPVPWVDHADRPSVREFFQGWGDRLVCLDGLEVDSVSHQASARICLTGGASGVEADWATRLGVAAANRFALPHVVIRAPSFSGADAALVTRVGTGGTLRDLLDGQALSSWNGVGGPASTQERTAVDAWVLAQARGRAAALSSDPAGLSYASLATAQERALWLQGLADQVSWPADASLDAQVDLALDLLELGVSRCVSLGADTPLWDSHTDNDSEQSSRFEELFAALLRLQTGLEGRPGSAGTLADETVVVVLSEMGRTPRLNSGGGKDHWTTTSALLWGPGLAGGRVVGAYDEVVRGRRVDPATLVVDDGGVRLEPRVLGKTLLALGGEESQDDLAEVEALEGLLT